MLRRTQQTSQSNSRTYNRNSRYGSQNTTYNRNSRYAVNNSNNDSDRYAENENDNVDPRSVNNNDTQNNRYSAYENNNNGSNRYSSTNNVDTRTTNNNVNTRTSNNNVDPRTVNTRTEAAEEYNTNRYSSYNENFTCFENVAFPLRVHTKLDEELIRIVVLMKLEAVGLRGAIDFMPSELSGGMQRRVALARAIALDPEMIMYDEPFVGQDPIGLGVLLSLVEQLNQALGLTSIIVSHDLQETLSIAEHVIMIANSTAAFEGSPEAMRSSSDPLVQQFLNGQPDGPVSFHLQAASMREMTS